MMQKPSFHLDKDYLDLDLEVDNRIFKFKWNTAELHKVNTSATAIDTSHLPAAVSV